MYCPECDGQKATRVYPTIKLFGRTLMLEICLCKDCDWVNVGDWWWKEEDEYLESLHKVTVAGSHSGYRGDGEQADEASRQDEQDPQPQTITSETTR